MMSISLARLAPMQRLLPLCVAWLLASAPAAGESAHGLAMHGRLKYPADFAHFDYVDPKAPRGGELRRAAIGTFDSFNPFIIKGNPAAGVGLLYDRLAESAADEPFSAYALLAESIETPPDRSWVAFTLRPEARWHDGKPVTPGDVIWSFETLLAKGAPFYRFYYANVAGVKQTGERTVRFDFHPGENRELPLILGQLPVLPQHYWKDREFDATTLEPPLGSGPYRIASFEPGRFVRFERVEEYWGRDVPVNVGRHNFDAQRFDYYRDATVALEAFKGGSFDFRLENNSKDWATAYDVPEVEQGRIRKELIEHGRPAGMQGFVFNLRREQFRDPRVRRALAYAFDFEWSNQTLFYGQYARTRSYFDNSELAATGLPSAAELEILEPHREQLPTEVFTEEYSPPATDGSGRIRANLRRATLLLGEAGWGIQDGALTHRESGRPMRFEILLVQPGFERIVLPYVKNLKRLGVEAEVRVLADTAQYRRRLDEFDFDMVVGSWGQSLSPGNEQREFWGSAAAERKGSRNHIGIRDPAIDALVEALIAAPDRDSLVVRTRALDRALQWGHYVVPHYHIGADRIAFWDKFGRPARVPMQGFQLDAWWVDPKRAAALRRGQPASRTGPDAD